MHKIAQLYKTRQRLLVKGIRALLIISSQLIIAGVVVSALVMSRLLPSSGITVSYHCIFQ